MIKSKDKAIEIINNLDKSMKQDLTDLKVA